jgi:hypothetical protein
MREYLKRPRRARAFACAVVLATACGEGRSWFASNDRSTPDSLPLLRNDTLPFKYPVGLYMQLIDDSVTLRLHIDAYGRPVPDSTRIEVHAAHAAFDSSALAGSRELVFRPAFKDGKPIPFTVLFPINFRIPTVPVTPADTSTPPDTGGPG